MFIIDEQTNRVIKIKEKHFTKLGLKERENLQEWIVNDPEFFGEELLFIQKEFDGFDDTRERLDLLALDKFGDIVVIENKLDDTGKDVVWQVLKYASYCASLSKVQIKNIYQQYIDKGNIDGDAETNITEFFGANDFEEVILNKSQRIIMVSGSFRKEVTSTVLWLLNNYKLKIQCFKVTPFSMGNQLLMNLEQIIPVKEAEEYMIRMADKNQEDSDAKEELKARHKIRLEFWKQLLEKVNQSETKLFQNINPSKDHWLSSGIGMSGLGLNFVVSKSYARTELMIARSEKEENKFIFDQLYQKKEQIEQEFGDQLTWERLNTKKSCRVKYEMQEVSLYEKEDWAKMMEYLIENMIKMEKAILKPAKATFQKMKRNLKTE